MHFPMIELKHNLHEVVGWMNTTIEGLAPEGLTDEVLKEYYEACPEMKRLEEWLGGIRDQLIDLWTPDMNAQLAREEEAYQDLDDRHDVQSY